MLRFAGLFCSLFLSFAPAFADETPYTAVGQAELGPNRELTAACDEAKIHSYLQADAFCVEKKMGRLTSRSSAPCVQKGRIVQVTTRFACGSSGSEDPFLAD